MTKIKFLTTTAVLLFILLYNIISAVSLNAEIGLLSDNYSSIYKSESLSIKNVNGKLYAYTVLLFNENPHFVNLIQKDSIPLKIIGNEGFHIKQYNNYILTINDKQLKKLAETLLSVYLEPGKYNSEKLKQIEYILIKKNIILKFSKDKNFGKKKILLDYCIYGKKFLITTKHPLLSIKEKIYNIQPFIYYDEFSTSNSTFYFNMIYINPGEVHNDFVIARKTINNIDIKSMFFVGSRVTDDIIYCLKKAFKDNTAIKEKIWEMFVIHELTHKYLNNKYNYYDQVTGEELSLCSTIFFNPYLGLSVMYSYLNYNSINPHRVAAMNFVRYVADKTGNVDVIENPGMLKIFNSSRLKKLSRDYFQKILNGLN